eukprot:gnl/MRDRNA2_/MRDRNA2_66889_c0_seq1.p1 gnl/MRDRNA2_/MRDRNA2_66889_c0~~gnl/MRDRNA2_/MRDRNA2_66889_c0_seq1.p1  ORF type:complete len:224 (+),score=43.01 gnl/MRDRNA2_/MRDRNA2_66889_c0_seq1:140-811(+)
MNSALEPADAVRVEACSCGRGVFSLQNFTPEDVIFCERPIVQIKDSDALDMQLCAEPMWEGPSPYASLYLLIKAQVGGVDALKHFNEGCQDCFAPSLLADINAAAAEICEIDEMEEEHKCQSRLIAFQSNAWRCDGHCSLYKTACMINHSCCPNVRFSIDAKRVEVIALHAICSGEELRVHYAAPEVLNLTVGERRQALAKTWGFLCSCQRCSNELLLAQPNS